VLAACHRHGARAQIDRTLCDWAQAHAALRAGCGVPHLIDAMGGVGPRGGNTATAALAWAEHAEIVTDGLHVHRAEFELAQRAVPASYQVPDGTAPSGMPDGHYALGSHTVQRRDGRVSLPDGTLAGSCRTQRASLQVLRGRDLDWHAIDAPSSAVPGRWPGDERVGRIGPGTLAHRLEIRDDVPVARWRGGRRHAWDAATGPG